MEFVSFQNANDGKIITIASEDITFTENSVSNITEIHTVNGLFYNVLADAETVASEINRPHIKLPTQGAHTLCVYVGNVVTLKEVNDDNCLITFRGGSVRKIHESHNQIISRSKNVQD